MAAAVSAQGPRPPCPGLETRWRQRASTRLISPSPSSLPVPPKCSDPDEGVSWESLLATGPHFPGPTVLRSALGSTWFCFEEIRHVRLSGRCLHSQEEEAS